jgi:hypothetical protein
MIKKISAEEFIKKHNIKIHVKKEVIELFKEINKESSKFEELKSLLYTSHDVEKRCEAIKKLVESEDPRGRQVLYEILDHPDFYLDHIKAITSSIHDVSRKKGYISVLTEYWKSRNEMQDCNSEIELFYDHLESAEWGYKEDVAQKLTELMSIEMVYPLNNRYPKKIYI